MKQFEYKITTHDAADFKRVAVFCSMEGECNLEEIPGDHIQQLSGILRDQGLAGWELVQVSFGKDGMLAFWKQEKASG